TTETKAGDESLVTADDHHHQQVRDHDHVYQPQHHQHNLLLAKAVGVGDEGPKLLQEQNDVNRLGDDEPEIKGLPKPAGGKDKVGEWAKARIGKLGHGPVRLRVALALTWDPSKRFQVNPA